MIIEDNRTAHMISVANYMYERAKDFKLNPKTMYTIGLLHDIGYLESAENHDADGVEILKKLGVSDDVLNIIGNHSLTPEEYKIKYNTCEIPHELILLWEADMSVDSAGNLVNFAERLNDIGKRHGYNSEPYNKCRQKIDWLIEEIIR